MSSRCDLSVTVSPTRSASLRRLANPVAIGLSLRTNRWGWRNNCITRNLPTLDTSPNALSRSQYAPYGVWFESVAQLVEHRPFKALVLGSSPSALTIKHPINIGDIDFSLYCPPIV